MSEAESPQRRARRDGSVTPDDIRELTGAATPHFAQQIRNRVARMIEALPDDDATRILGEEEIRRLTELSFSGEVRGGPTQPGLPGLPSTDISRD